VAAGAPRAAPDDRVDAGRVLYLSGADGHAFGVLEGQAPGDRMGQALANAGVGDDGIRRLVVGLPGHHAAEQQGTGTVLVVAPAQGSILLRIDGPAGSHAFGAVVAAGADFDGDGHPDFVAADPRADVEGRPGAGLVQVLSGSDGRLLFTASGDAADGLGSAVAFPGDLNGDGRADLLLGAPLHDVLTVPDVGAALAFADLP
jgi:FG-GAP-like repeat